MVIINLLLPLVVLCSCIFCYRKEYSFNLPTKISMLIATMIFSTIYLFFKNHTNLFGLLIEMAIVGFFIYLTATDIYKLEIPNRINLIILILGIIHGIVIHTMISNLFSAFILFLIFILIAHFSNGGMGGGDIKYVIAFGFFLLPNQLLPFLWISCFSALVFGLLYIFVLSKDRSKKDPFPFGPFLILASFYLLFLN